MSKVDRSLLKQFISEDKSPEVITYLLKLTESKKSHLHNDLVIISSQLRELEGQTRKNLASIGEVHTQKAKIANSVLSIIDTLSEEDLESDIVWNVGTDSTKVIFQADNSRINTLPKTTSVKEKIEKSNTNKWVLPTLISALFLGLIYYTTFKDKPNNETELIKESLTTNSSKEENDIINEKRDKEDITAKIKSWNHANEYKNPSILSQLYANQIEHFYGTKNVTKKYCIIDQTNDFTQNPNSHQNIKGDIDFVKIDNRTYKCYFDKEVIKNEQTQIYRAILKFQKQEGEFKIIAETTMKDGREL